MYPLFFEESLYIRRTSKPLNEHESVSVVLYCASTVGLEAYLARLPTIRYLITDGLAMNILPGSVIVPTTDFTKLLESVRNVVVPTDGPLWEDVFPPVQMSVWRDILGSSS